MSADFHLKKYTFDQWTPLFQGENLINLVWQSPIQYDKHSNDNENAADINLITSYAGHWKGLSFEFWGTPWGSFAKRLISAFAAVIITPATRGRSQTRDVDMGHRKLLPSSTYMAVFLMRRSWSRFIKSSTYQWADVAEVCVILTRPPVVGRFQFPWPLRPNVVIWRRAAERSSAVQG